MVRWRTRPRNPLQGERRMDGSAAAATVRRRAVTVGRDAR